MNSNVIAKHRIVVLGAGYAGVHAAGRLARRLHADDVEITLVNADEEFVERVRMHQLAVGQQLRHLPLRDALAGTGVTLRKAFVRSVDVDSRTVEISDESGVHEIGYDSLVYALGSTVAEHGVPGVAEHAQHVATRAGALALRERLLDLPGGANVLVVGGGLTGIEAVTEIAESRPDLAVSIAAQGGVGDWLGEKARAHLHRVFRRLSIIVHENADVERVDEMGVVTRAGDRIPAAVTVWSAGFAAHPIAAATTLKVADTGQIVVDAGMRSVSHPDVYAVGDAAFAAGAGDRTLRMSCASGVPTAWRAADAIAARLTGRTAADGDIGYVQQCVSLGRSDGIIQFVTADDRARPAALTGRLAARYKEFICAGAAWAIAHPTLLMPSRRRHVTAIAAVRR